MSEREPRFRLTYRMLDHFGGWWHSYVALCEHGALELQITEYPKDMDVETTAGLETHYRKPPDYMAGDAPSHDRCMALGEQPCWHDGTSSYAMDHWLPLWKSHRNDPASILEMLKTEARERFFA